MVVVQADGHFVRRLLNCLGHRRVHQPQLLVGSRGGALNQPQRTYKRAREAQVADGEVVDCTLCLCAIERVRGHLDFAHAVAFDAMCLFCHNGSSFIFLGTRLNNVW